MCILFIFHVNNQQQINLQHQLNQLSQDFYVPLFKNFVIHYSHSSIFTFCNYKIFFKFLLNETTSCNDFVFNKDNISCSLAKIISNLFKLVLENYFCVFRHKINQITTLQPCLSYLLLYQMLF